MKTAVIEIKAQEAQVLVNLINVSVHVKGLEASEAGIHFAKKVSTLFNAQNGEQSAEDKTLDLNEQEAQVLINLLNIAVMAKGLEVAEAALFFVKKINEAFAIATPQTAEV